MSIESKIALAMSADGDSFERVHSNLVKIADEFAIGFGQWLIKKEHEYTNKIIAMEELLEIYKKQKGL